MKKTIVTLLLALGACASAQAVYTGATVGRLIDSEEAPFSAHVGTALKTTEQTVHNLELEVLFSDLSDSTLDLDLTAALINYRGEILLKESNFAPYYGVGVGAGQWDVKAWFGSDKATSLAVQAFGGVAYKVTPSATLNLGLRYIYFDDVKVFSTNVDPGDDVAVEVGFSFRF